MKRKHKLVTNGIVGGAAGVDQNLAALSRGEAVLPADTTQAVGPENVRALIAATHQPTQAPAVKALRGKVVPAHADGKVPVDDQVQKAAALYGAAHTPLAGPAKAESFETPWYLPDPNKGFNRGTPTAPIAPPVAETADIMGKLGSLANVVNGPSQRGAIAEPTPTAPRAATPPSAPTVPQYDSPSSAESSYWAQRPLQQIATQAPVDAVAQVAGGGRSLALTAAEMGKQYATYQGNPEAYDRVKAEYGAMQAKEEQNAQQAFNERQQAMMNNVRNARGQRMVDDAQLAYYSHPGTANTLAAAAAREQANLGRSLMDASLVQAPARNLISEYGTQQADIGRQLATNQALRESAAQAPLNQKALGLKNALAQAGVDEATFRKQMQNKLVDPKATPEERRQAKEWMLAVAGKTEHDVGRFRTRDTFNDLGQRTGQEIFDSTTGDTVHQGALTKPSPEQAAKEAQDAIAKGASKDAVNARLKNWGYPAI